MSLLLLTLACGPDDPRAVLYCQPSRRCGDRTRCRAMAVTQPVRFLALRSKAGSRAKLRANDRRH